MKAAAALALAAAVLAACGSSSEAVPGFSGAVKRSRAARVVLLVMENKDRGQIIGSADAPYMTALARRYGTAQRSFAITHPSLPNYLALVSGSTHGITSDCTDCRVSGPNLGTQLDRAKLGWKSYQEGLPRPCFTGAAAGRYARKHDPFAYWNARDCRHRVSFGVLKADLRRGAAAAVLARRPGPLPRHARLQRGHGRPLPEGARAEAAARARAARLPRADVRRKRTPPRRSRRS